MARTASANGHPNGKANREFLRAPKEGIRLGGKFYRAGVRLPERYRRRIESGGISSDPADGVPLAPPNMGRLALPHAMTFIGKQGTIANVYRNPDEAVLRSGGQSWKMRRDPAIMECLEARQRATALLNWHLEVEDEKEPVQKALKDELTKIVMRSRQFTEYRRNLLEALWCGRYAVEHKFGFKMIGGKRRCYLEDWTPINGDKLLFRYDDGSGKYDGKEIGIKVSPIHGTRDKLAGDRLIEYTTEGPAYFLEPWERNLIAIHKHIIEDGDYEDPISAGRIHGVGIRDRIYWCWFQKQETMAQLMEVIDRTGSGITIYWYPHGDPAAQAEVREMAEKQRHENVLIMPRMSGDPSMDAYGIERIEPTTAGIEAMKGVVHEFFGHQIKRYISGQTLTSESEALGIGGGASDVQQETWFQIICYDAIKLEETITEELIEPLKRFNFPEAHDIPVWFRIDTKSADSEKKMNAIRQGWDMGLRIKASDVMDIVGLSMPAEDDEVLQNPQMMPQADPLMGGMPGQTGAAGGAEQGSLEDLFGPLAAELGGGGPEGQDGDDGGEPPPNPSEGGGPVKYAKSSGYYTRDDLKAAIAATNTDPTDAQKEAGNYAKGKLTWNGLTISIENPAGSKRRPEWKPLAHHYGYINRTEGKDGDHVDVFLGPDLDSDLVVVVDQCTEGGRFDEHKCLIGFHNADEAAEGYLANYQDGWKLGPVTTMTVEQFRCWLEEGDTTKPVGEQVSRYARRRQIRSSPGQKPLPALGDANIKQHYLWREELHPRDAGGKFAEKPGGRNLPHQFGQKWIFSEMAAKIHETEDYPDSKTAQAKQKELFEALAGSDIHPEQLAAFLSGDEDRMRELQEHALATGQHEMPADETEGPEGETPGAKPETPPYDREAADRWLAEARAQQAAMSREVDESKLPPKEMREALAAERARRQGKHGPSSPDLEPSTTPPEGIPGGSTPQPGGDGFELERQAMKIGRGLGTEDKTPETSKGRQEAFWHGMDDAEGQGKLFDGLDLAGGDRPAFGEQDIEAQQSPAVSPELEGAQAIAGMPFYTREEAQAVARKLEEVGKNHGLSGEEMWQAVMGEPEGSSSYPLYDQTEDDAVRHDIATAKQSNQAQFPHEMTLAEYKTRRGDNSAAVALHKKEVRNAIKAGKSVPPEVLADYPDLSGKKTPKAKSSEQLTAEDKPAASGAMSLDTLAQHSKAIRSGEASADQIRQWFEDYHGNQEPVRAELNKKTVAELKKMGAGGFHASGMKKSELVDSMLNQIGEQYNVTGSLQWSMSEKRMDALRRTVHGQTDDHVKAYAERVKGYQAERQQRREEISKALTNPETLEEFDTFVRAQGRDKLSDEQLAKYDDLKASKRREGDAAKRSTVQGFSGGSEKAGAVGIVEGHHQKRNTATYTVTVEKRLGDEGYREALSRAKSLGGNYVNAMTARRYGATPGFQFFDRASAESFAKVMKGESADRTEAEQERKAERIENASERLAALAANTHAAADEQLGRERLTNTSRRADMAASAEAYARSQKALAETMERLSGAMAEGKAKHLEGIRHRKHVEELNWQLRSARRSRMTAEKAHELPYDKREEMDQRPPEAEDIRHVEYPYPKIWGSQLQQHAAEFENEPGLKMIAARLKKAGASKIKFKGQGNGIKFSGGRILSPKDLESVRIHGLKEGKGIRVHQSHDWRLAKEGKGRGPFYTADGGKTFSPTPDIAVNAAVNRGHDLDIVDLPEDELITLDDPREIADLTAAVSKLRRSPKRDLRHLAEQLHSRLDSYNRLQAMDIKGTPELRAALREYLPLRTKPKGEDKIKRLERDLIGKKIEGFFPTPRPLIERMIEAAGIESGHAVLEPSAGKGDILDAVRDRHPEAVTHGIEPVSSLREIIEAKGHSLVDRDFLEHQGEYDRVIMNPPFEKGQDAAHVRHAFGQLKPGGRLVAIMSAGPFGRSDKKSEEFRQWLEEVGGHVEDLPEGSFAGKDAFRQTGVNTKLVVIDK